MVFPGDTIEAVRQKKVLYAQVRRHLIDDIERRLSGAGHIESLEISTAVDAVQGAAAGTAPWMFASLAIDAAAGINETRTKRGKPALPLKFKFTDALGRFGGR